MEDIYTLNELIKTLEIVRKNGEVLLNIPKALYCLAQEIKSMKENLIHGK